MMKKCLFMLLMMSCISYTAVVRAEFSVGRRLNPIFLLYNPLDHDISYGQILGYLSYEEEDIILYFGRDDWLYGNRENGVLIVPKEGTDVENWDIFDPKSIPSGGLDWLLNIDGTLIPSDKEESKGCIAKYEATRCFGVGAEIVFQPESREAVVEYLCVPDGWDTSLDNGDGSSEDQALPVSMYRYVVRGQEYYGKWITITGRMIGTLQLIWPGSEFCYPLDFIYCQSESYFHGSLIRGLDKDGLPVFNDRDYAYGMMTTVHAYVDVGWISQLPEQFGPLKETQIQKVPKRGEARE